MFEQLLLTDYLIDDGTFTFSSIFICMKL